ncbi:hypothetical protein Tco_0126558 [Tanacetum coccineum]
MAAEVPQTFEYRGGKLNAAPLLEVENFINWKKRFICHVIGIKPQFENIIKNGLYILMINSVINFLTAKSTWDDLILYHESPSDVKESRVMDLKFCYNTFKFKEESELASVFGKLKYEESLIDIIYNNENKKALTTPTPLSTAFISTSIVQDFQDSPDDEENTRSSQEYLNELKGEYQARALLAKSKRLATTTPYIIRMYAFTISIANLVADSSFYLIIIDFPTCKFQSRIIPAGKEVDIELDKGRDKDLHPTDMLLYSWDKGIDVCVDLTGSTGLVAFVSDRAAIEVAQRKCLESLKESFSSSSLGTWKIKIIFTSVYAAVQNLKKTLKVYKTRKTLLYVKKNKADLLGKETSKIDAFNPHVSPAKNLLWILNYADSIMGSNMKCTRSLGGMWRRTTNPSTYFVPCLLKARRKTRSVSFLFHVSYKLQNPKAIRIILGLRGRVAAGQETEDPFQGYAFEIFLPARLFNVEDAKQYKTSELWTIRIPKKKGECVQTVGGDLLFYTKDICKLTLWRPI